MRTNIDIDDALMDAAMRAGPFASKREAVAAGLQLLARKAAYRDILALRGKLQWDDEPLPPHVAPPNPAPKAHSPSPPPYGKRAKGGARAASRKVSST
ncbi:MAG: type II toxin-antitoxin system VapB family antitoxin [Burkholderiales bacterium]|nr:type II toxin-antitoxin system VapB family antitoxin [Burkholderiales bacterium]